MLQITISRLRNLWPDAVIQVFTSRSDLLEKHCPGAVPLAPSHLNIEFSSLSAYLEKVLKSRKAVEITSKLEWKFHQKLPVLTQAILKRKLKKLSNYSDDFKELIKLIEDADLVIASGGGYITDFFQSKAANTLEILNLATWFKKPSVILGQGIGPLQNSDLKHKARIVLPRLDLISLRESKASLPLLNSLGVSNQSTLTTGDDAIELVYKARASKLGSGIGINLRITSYSNIDTQQDVIENLRLTIQEFAREKAAALVPIPIANRPTENDPESIKMLLKGYDDESDGGQNLSTPLEVINQIRYCRIVVTGSYHAGVFALSQGVPVVCLTKSKYYEAKFAGLAEQFKLGCELVSLSGPQLKENLTAAIYKTWELADQTREKLLIAASKQVDLGCTAYQQLYKLVEA